MKRILIAVILILSLLLIPITVSAASGVEVANRTGDGEWIGNIWEVSIYPNETKATTITLYNSSSINLDVEVTIVPDSLDNGNLTFGLSSENFTMLGKSYTDVTLTVEASGSTTPGTYTTEFTIKAEEILDPSPITGGGGGLPSLNIYGLKTENITENSADIVWKTNRTAFSKVVYWASLVIVIESDEYIKKHLVHLENLTDGTTYTFEVVCEDKYGMKDKEDGIFATLVKVAEPVAPKPEEPVPPEPEEPTVKLEYWPTPAPEKPIMIPKPDPPLLEVVPESAGIQWQWIILGVIGIGVIVYGIFYWRRRKARAE